MQIVGLPVFSLQNGSHLDAKCRVTKHSPKHISNILRAYEKVKDPSLGFGFI